GPALANDGEGRAALISGPNAAHRGRHTEYGEEVRGYRLRLSKRWGSAYDSGHLLAVVIRHEGERPVAFPEIAEVRRRYHGAGRAVTSVTWLDYNEAVGIGEGKRP